MDKIATRPSVNLPPRRRRHRDDRDSRPLPPGPTLLALGPISPQPLTFQSLHYLYSSRFPASSAQPATNCAGDYTLPPRLRYIPIKSLALQHVFPLRAGPTQNRPGALRRPHLGDDKQYPHPLRAPLCTKDVVVPREAHAGRLGTPQTRGARPTFPTVGGAALVVPHDKGDDAHATRGGACALTADVGWLSRMADLSQEASSGPRLADLS